MDIQESLYCKVDSSHLAPLSKDDDALRARYKVQAQDELCGATRHSRSQRMDTEDDANCGYGLLGLGDRNYAINQSLFKECSSEKGFVDRLAQQFRQEHGFALDSGAMEIQTAAKKQCFLFCTTTGLYGKDPLMRKKVTGLLLNICRSMKRQVRDATKHITADNGRHPLLLTRWLTETGQQTSIQGWLLAKATFKPLQVDGVCLDLPALLGKGASINLRLKQVYKSSTRSFDFKCMREIAANIVGAHATPDTMQYCYSPVYTIGGTDFNLATLTLVDDLDWHPLGGRLPFDAGSDSDGGSEGSEDERVRKQIESESKELENIMGLLGLAPSTSSSAKSASTKPKPKPKSSSARATSTRKEEPANDAANGTFSKHFTSECD